MDGSPDYHGHRQRLRARFLADPAGLQDYELLELLLMLALPRRDVKPLAKALIRDFGTYAAVIAAPVERLTEVNGVKESAALALKIVAASAERMAKVQVMNRPVISSWTALLDYCRTAMAYLEVEQFRILFLDRRNVLIADEVQAEGTVNHAPVYIREIMKRALSLNASALILVHNHPSGDPAPSQDDIVMTKEIRDAARKLDIELHDHLVVGRKGHASFKALGLL